MMKKILTILIVFLIVLILIACPPTSNDTNDSGDSNDTGDTGSTGEIPSDAIIIDHNCTDIASIPQIYIDAVKSADVLHYAQRSHGSQLLIGAEALETASPTDYPYVDAYCGLPNNESALKIWYGMTTDDYVEPEEYWATTAGINDLKSILDNNSSVKYTMWSWCAELDDWNESQVNDYLNAISSLESQYPNVVFIYMTGNAQATYSPAGMNRHLRNEQIRQYCSDNDKVLFDFADLDCWYNGVENTTTDSDGTYPSEHPQYSGDNGGHTTEESCINKAKALWWMMARLNGWDGQ